LDTKCARQAGDDDPVPMLYVTPVIEGLRAQPNLVFWGVALLQVFLWTLVPTLFFASPPGELPQLLAIGHEWVAGSSLGPPLAPWLAEIAFTLAGHRVFGIYLLSQICVVATYWVIFTLGSSIVGARHAALAVMLMAATFVFSASTTEFGPAVLAMPLAALTFLHLWRALGEDKELYWFAVGLDLGLFFLATYSALIIVAAIVLFLMAVPRARPFLTSFHPWAAFAIALLVASPHLIWLAMTGASAAAALQGFGLRLASFHIQDWLWLVTALLAAHLGLGIFAAVAVAQTTKKSAAPVIVGAPTTQFAKAYVYFFAVVPVLLGAVV
jgi:4-amino-4-deoxy-L-arabinose transferase-like glycosyltransferase